MLLTRVRLSRQSLRDLSYWRSLDRGEGRDLHRLELYIRIHSDAADVGYGGTLGKLQEAGTPSLWEGRGFWVAQDRVESITSRALRPFRMLLQRHFAYHVSHPHIRLLLLHEDNYAMLYVLNAIISSSKPLIAELRRLQRMRQVLRVCIEERWLPWD